ncbi:D-isomer specific 2-hydroxyacid dehydrogenase family protein [Isoptericola sp. NPDC057653]|uniref:D-isomer specific 2-hydroxyacid dehydrogenase family protein n=1 Tax=Isoptericola sp. NPDC057653 TaxID=3346195 RepID=UPI00369425C2
MDAPGITAAPQAPAWVPDAVEAAGARLVPLGAETEGLLWFGGYDAAGLQDSGLGGALASAPGVRWGQLPSSGVDGFASAGLLRETVTWTSAKGAFARPVAEHALALTLASLRHLPERARARSWGRPAGATLFGARVLVLGAGGIARTYLDLLTPFGTHDVVVRRRPEPVPGAARTVTSDHLLAELAEADVVMVAAALTAETRAILGAAELAAMKPGAVLVNIARGGLVDTDALLDALASGHLGAAALDVTDPEPLPDGHPLWDAPRVLITPHTADTAEMIAPLLRGRVEENLRRFVSGRELVGVVDTAAGY